MSINWKNKFITCNNRDNLYCNAINEMLSNGYVTYTCCNNCKLYINKNNKTGFVAYKILSGMVE